MLSEWNAEVNAFRPRPKDRQSQDSSGYSDTKSAQHPTLKASDTQQGETTDPFPFTTCLFSPLYYSLPPYSPGRTRFSLSPRTGTVLPSSPSSNRFDFERDRRETKLAGNVDRKPSFPSFLLYQLIARLVDIRINIHLPR